MIEMSNTPESQLLAGPLASDTELNHLIDELQQLAIEEGAITEFSEWCHPIIETSDDDHAPRAASHATLSLQDPPLLALGEDKITSIGFGLALEADLQFMSVPIAANGAHYPTIIDDAILTEEFFETTKQPENLALAISAIIARDFDAQLEPHIALIFGDYLRHVLSEGDNKTMDEMVQLDENNMPKMITQPAYTPGGRNMHNVIKDYLRTIGAPTLQSARYQNHQETVLTQVVETTEVAPIPQPADQQYWQARRYPKLQAVFRTLSDLAILQPNNDGEPLLRLHMAQTEPFAPTAAMVTAMRTQVAAEHDQIDANRFNEFEDLLLRNLPKLS